MNEEDNPWIAITDWYSPLILIHPDGSGLFQVDVPSGERTHYFTNLKWSPDGRFLGYAKVESRSGKASIWIYQIGFPEPYKLLDNTHGGLDWYPDGSAILFDKYAERTIIPRTMHHALVIILLMDLSSWMAFTDLILQTITRC